MYPPSHECHVIHPYIMCQSHNQFPLQDDPEIIEGDEGEEMMAGSEEASGEALLSREYLAIGLEEEEQEAGGKGIGLALVLDAPYARPVTPQMFGNRPQTANLPGMIITII